MALTDKHPQYSERLGEYIQMADTYAGERAVKAKRLDYLPAQEGMVQDGMQTPQSPGWKDYEAYLLRAYFHDVMKDAVKAMIGVMHEQDAEITLSPRLKSMLTSATAQGESLQSLLRRINVAQLVYGRLGLLAEVPIGAAVNEAVPYLSFYDPLRIINWDTGDQNEGKNDLDLVVLDESGFARKGFTWQTQRKYRVLARGGEDVLKSGGITPDIGDPYGVCVKVNDESLPLPEQFIVPHIGGKALNKIPFVIIGANDLVFDPEVPPLLGLSNLALAIYRGEADYRQTLYMQGQNTLVITGGNMDETNPQQLRVGAKGVIDLRIGGDAKYIGVSAAGLGEMRQSLKNDQDRAAREGVAFLDVGADTSASGEALRIRTAARVTTVTSVAKAGGAGLENILKICAEWVGDDPDEVSVKPYTDFADQTIAGAALLAFMQAKQLGLPLSLKSMHRMMKVQDMTEMDFEAEQQQIEDEAETMLGMMVGPQLAQQGVGDEFLNDPGQTTPPAKGEPPAQPGSTAPPNNNTPVKPHARAGGHTRGSPVPLKRKGTHKGASAGK